jgi:hypothetical protein
MGIALAAHRRDFSGPESFYYIEQTQSKIRQMFAILDKLRGEDKARVKRANK